MHAELQIDDTVVMIADSGKDHPAFPVWSHVYVPNVDTCYERLLKIGGTSVQKPTQKPGDPDRRGELKIPPAIRGGSQRNYREGQSLLRAKSRTAYESRAAFIGAVDGQASSIDNDVINHARAP